MKKLMMLGAMLAAATAFGEVRLATVDMMLLVRNHPSYDTNKNTLMTTEKDYQKRLDAFKEEVDKIQAEGKKLADEYRNPMLAQAAKTKIEADLTAVQSRYVAAQQKLRNEAMRNQQELSDLEARLLKAQAQDLKKRISDYAGKHGYDLVLDSAAALYSVKGLDITDEILKAMNVDPKKAKAKEKDESK